MKMRFSGHRIWEVRVNFRAEVKVMGERAKNTQIY